MNRGANRWLRCVLPAALICLVCAGETRAQRGAGTVAADDAEFGPVVSTYLGYLRAEQDVVDDRVSRREVSPAYYRRNSNRIRALRQLAVRIARTTQNDFLPELYAVTRDELGTLFETPPQPAAFRIGEVLDSTFRYLGTVRSAEVFYMFARLDVYEQAELLQRGGTLPPDAAAASAPDAPAATDSNSRGNRPTTRPRRVNNP